MTEKRKWFDSKVKRQAKIPIPQPFGLQSNVTDEQCELLLEEMSKQKIPVKVIRLFSDLAVMPPICRLGRNLKVLLVRLVERPMVDFMRDALRPDELSALISLAKMETQYQEIGQGLLNIDERYQLAEAAKAMFAVERNREKEQHGG